MTRRPSRRRPHLRLASALTVLAAVLAAVPSPVPTPVAQATSAGGYVASGAVSDQDPTGDGGSDQRSTPPPRPIRWAALGDSYSSGEGLGDSEGDCQRSDRAYPPLAKAGLERAGWEIEDFDFLACTGVHASPGSGDEDGTRYLSGQVDQLNGEYDLITLTLGGNDAGFADVMRSCVIPDPTHAVDFGCYRLVREWNVYHELRLSNDSVPVTLDRTAMIGLLAIEAYEAAGLDLQARVAREAWELRVARITCYPTVGGQVGEGQGEHCNDGDQAEAFDLTHDEYRDLLMGEFQRQLTNHMDLDTVYDHLREWYARSSRLINSHLSPGGHVVVMGYPRLIEDPENWPALLRAAGVCGNIADHFVPVLRNAGEALNATVERATELDDAVSYLPVADEFEGHNVCSEDEWLNGISVGWRANFPPVRPEASFHPTEGGYEAMARLLAQHVRRLDWGNLSGATTLIGRKDAIEVAPRRGERTALTFGVRPAGRSATDVLKGVLGEPRPEDQLPPWAGGDDEPPVLGEPEPSGGEPECWEDAYGINVWRVGDQPYFAALYARSATTIGDHQVEAGALLGYRVYENTGMVSFSDRVPIGATIDDLKAAYNSATGHDAYAVQFGEPAPGGVSFQLAVTDASTVAVDPDLWLFGPDLGTATGRGDDDTIVERGAGLEGVQCGLDLVREIFGEDQPDDDPDGPDGGCGADDPLRVGIVLDSSPSIVDAGAEDQVRAAANGLVDALAGTGSEVRISSFSGHPADLTSGWLSLADADARRVANQAVSHMAFQGSGTNWETALMDLSGHAPDVVVLVTDGSPNQYGVGITSSSSSEGTNDFDPVALAAGVSAADFLRDDGARVIAVGAGDVRADSLAQVADEGDSYVGDFASLGAALAEVAGGLCGNGLTVQHRVGGMAAADAGYTLQLDDGDDDAEARMATTDADGMAYFGLPDISGTTATVQGPQGLPVESIACEQGGSSVNAEVDEQARSVSVDVGGGPVTCTFDWRNASGASTVAEIVNGPGVVRTLNFEPQPESGPAVIGCLGMGDATSACDAAHFGVSFEAGFAVIRYEEGCAGCPDPDTLEVTGGAQRVSFQFDAGQGIGTSDHLDLAVGTRPLSTGMQVSGSVGGNNALQVETVQPPPQLNQCLADFGAAGAGNRSIETGANC